MKGCSLLISFLSIFLCCMPCSAQLSYGASAAYGLRKINATYSGNAIRVRRTCDNGSTDIGFNSCGDLDSIALKAFVVAANPLSAMTVTSSTAFSLRRLRCTYSGNAIRVRSSATGSPTLDISFTANGDLDTAALKTFIGSNSGFITTWYDQSGNARDASQATTANQPRIINTGVIDQQNGRPAVYFTGTNCKLSTAAFTAFSAAACFNGIARVSSNLVYNTIHNKTSTNFPSPLDLYNNQMVIGDGSGGGYSFVSYGQTFNASLPLSIWTYQAASGGAYTFFYNGSITASGSVGQFGDNGNPFVLGGRADGLTGLNGWISESLTFNSLPSTTDRQFLEWSQAQYYFISSGPALTTLPIAPASGFVSTWYDQSGNSHHVTQSTNANQPLIIQTGSIQKQGVNLAVTFNGGTYLSASDAGLPTGNLAVSAIVKANSISTYGSFIHYGSGGGGNAVFGAYGTDANYGTNALGLSQYGDAIGIQNSTGPTWIFTSGRSSTSYSVYSNGTNGAFKTMASNTTLYGTNGLSIGAFNPSLSGGQLNGSLTELSVFPSSFSNTKRILLETNYSAFTTLTVAVNKYTAPSSTTYQRFINGIGRESASDSIAGTRNTVGMGISTGATSADFLKDNGDYITYGINCPISPAVSTSNLPGTITYRWLNDWYLNKTDINSNNGDITFFFDFSDYGLSILPGAPATYELLVRSTPSGNFSIVSGTIKSVVGDRVLFSVDASNISTNQYYTIGTKNYIGSPLPIELLSFDVTCENYKVNCNWSVASEKNNAYFLIERTQDGTTFEALGLVKGAGTNNTRKNYSYTDDRPLDGLAYYRLKQVDLDGAEHNYTVKSVTCASLYQGISIYPNPNSGTFILEGAKLYSDLEVIDVTGRQIYSQKNLLSKQEIKIDNLKQGIYFLKITDNSKITVVKMVVTY